MAAQHQMGLRLFENVRKKMRATTTASSKQVEI